MYGHVAMHTIGVPDMATCIRAKEQIERQAPRWFVDKPTLQAICIQLWED